MMMLSVLRKLYNAKVWQLYILLSLLFPNAAISQVINDNIANKIHLEVGKPFRSTTVNCTVEEDCVDESLTGKCIVYHNDQWFGVSVDTVATYFLNVSGQQCRDVFGVQVVVIDGTPCDVSTYQILNCYSTGSQDDVSIKLEGLIPGRSYLVNVDGYLHDFCSFDIEISNEAKGIPTDLLTIGKVQLTRTKQRNILKWSVSPDSAIMINYFEVWRRSGKTSKSEKVASIGVKRNTKGLTQLTYSFEDSVFTTPQHYKIVGVGHGSRFLIADVLTPADSILADNSENNNIKLALDFRKDSPITILIFDDVSGTLLLNTHFNFDRKKHTELMYYVGELKKKGIRFFRVEIIDNRNKSRSVFRYSK